MPLQRPPSPPSHDSSPFSSSSQPSLSTSSTSTSESPLRLSIPFGQLAIDDPASPQAQCVVYQQQYHFPRGPAAGTEDEGQAWDETMFNKRLAESAMGDAPQNTNCSAVVSDCLRPSVTSLSFIPPLAMSDPHRYAGDGALATATCITQCTHCAVVDLHCTMGWSRKRPCARRTTGREWEACVGFRRRVLTPNRCVWLLPLGGP
ncbi:hypothetical protein B0H21DRAFT_196639 [Amylocystis lapponica]|nr:hypothetical protein B0H21DRAFT_196639 [Amylocystis lapponica]